MRDLLDELLRWWRSGATAGLAMVTATWSSAPRPSGAAMLVAPDGAVSGSVSGGCVDGAAYQECVAVAATGTARILSYGDDATAADRQDVGELGDARLPCGGSIELIALPVSARTTPELPRLAAGMAAGEPVALLTRLDETARQLVLTPGGRYGTLGADPLDDTADRDGRDLLAAGTTAVREYEPGVRVLVSTFPPAARMIICGGTGHAAALARIGTLLGYRVTVCDARPVFATARRFPEADRVVADRPDRYLRAEAAAGRLDARTVVCVLTHDPKFDVPALRVALALPVAYVGAMGSRAAHEDRLARLRASGVDEPALARLASPIGLDLGGRTPEETAVSIAAEIVAVRRGGTGVRLSAADGRIHPHGTGHWGGVSSVSGRGRRA